MQTTLLALIVLIGTLGFVKRIPYHVASWSVVALVVFGIFTSPDHATRLMYVFAALLGPLLAYPLSVLFSMTIGPLMHYFSWRLDAHRSAFKVLPGDELYAAAGAQADEHVASLTASGFVSRGRVGLRVKKFTVVNEVLDHGDGREWVVLSSTLPTTVQPFIMHCSVSFADGHTLVVSTYPFVDPNPPVEGFEAVRLPSIADPNDLVRACLTLAARSTYGPVVRQPMDTDVVTLAHERSKRRLDAEVRAGFAKYDAANDVYRPTLLGAYRMFWVSLPPMKWIIDRRDRARERELLDEMKLKPARGTGAETGETGSAAPQASRKQRLKWLVEAAALIAVIIFLPDVVDAINPSSRPVVVVPYVDVPNGFMVPESFPDAVHALEQLVGRPSHQLMGTRDDNPAPTPGVAISMGRDTADAYVARAQQLFLAKGFYLFRTGERATSGLETEALALYPTSDPYVVMRAMETNGWNHGLSTEDVIAWFRREEQVYPVRFGAIGFDYVGGYFHGELPDDAEFARRFIKFCPDIQSEGPVSARSLGRDFNRTREIFCWWD
jgi:hypothetical protein